MKEHVFQLFRNYSDVLETYGLFEYLDDETIQDVPINYIWSVAEFDDGIHLISGKSESSAVDYYAKSSQPWAGAAFEIDVFEVIYFDCEDCDGASDCNYCDQEANLSQIDFNAYLETTFESQRNAESLWQSREPMGTEHVY